MGKLITFIAGIAIIISLILSIVVDIELLSMF